MIRNLAALLLLAACTNAVEPTPIDCECTAGKTYACACPDGTYSGRFVCRKAADVDETYVCQECPR